MRLQIIALACVLTLADFGPSSLAQSGGKGPSQGGSTDFGALGIPSTDAKNAGNKYKDLLYGVVKSVSKDSIVLTKTSKGLDQTFKLDKKTKFLYDGKNSSLEHLKPGDHVWVDARTDKKTGDLIARKVVSGAFLM